MSASTENLQTWLAELPGRAIVEVESRIFDELVVDLFGYHLMQLGRLADADAGTASRILHRVVVDIGCRRDIAPGPHLYASAAAMPIASDSVDVVLMPHVLEFESSPHDALRETFRVLVPGGHAVISVFNPLSMMGVWRVFRRHRRRAPWNGQFFTLSRLRDWLVLLGFDIVTTRPCFFAPPLRSASLVTRCLEAEPVCRRLFPYLAGVHVVLARKRVFAITPLRPKWDRPRRLLAGGLVEPTTRSQDDA